MNFISQDYKPINLESGMKPQDVMYWAYRIAPESEKHRRGYVLTTTDIWRMVDVPSYSIKIGTNVVDIPANHYIVIADLDRGIDFIRMDEIVGRPFEALTISPQLDGWGIKDFTVVGYKEDSHIPYPENKTIIPILIGNRAILVSSVDHYNKVSSYTFTDFE